MGGSKKQTIGYSYLMGLHSVICKGPVDALLGIKVGDRDAWTGRATASGAIVIDKPTLFGGDKSEGGISGTLALMFGEPTQAKNSYLVSVLGERQPAYRGVFGTVFQKGMVASMNPYLKAWAYRVRRNTKGWEGGTCWYPTKAAVDVGGGILCANPAHIAYEILTNTEDGMGYPPGRMDDASFRAAADLFYTEGLGLFLTWTQSDGIESVLQNLNDHANMMVIQDPRTLLFQLIPMRGNYTVASLPCYGPRQGADANGGSETYDVGCVLESFERTAVDEIVNEVTVKWNNSDDNSDGSITTPNLAAQEAAGGIINQTKTYAACPTSAIAARLCQRDLDVISTALARVRLRANRNAAGAFPGAVIRLAWPPLGLVDMPIRVLRVTTGNQEGGEVTIEGTEDVFKFGATTYIAPQQSGWTPPRLDPIASPNVEAFETPYRDLVQIMGSATAAAQDPDAGYLGLASEKPVGTVSYGVELFEKTGSADYSHAGRGDFTPTGTLHDAIVAEAGPTTITLDDARSLEHLTVGEVGFIGTHPGAEYVMVTAILSNVLTVARGCLDTTPADWPAGSRFWGYDNYGAASQTEYATGELVYAKAATVASAGTLPVASAPADSVSMNGRQARPYPPGNLRINGEAYPATVIGGLALTWSHRDRLVQADTVRDTTSGNVGPETDTTYTVRVYLDGVLQSTDVDITDALFTPASPAAGTVKVAITADRDGTTSWQSLAATFAFTP